MAGKMVSKSKKEPKHLLSPQFTTRRKRSEARYLLREDWPPAGLVIDPIDTDVDLAIAESLKMKYGPPNDVENSSSERSVTLEVARPAVPEGGESFAHDTEAAQDLSTHGSTGSPGTSLQQPAPPHRPAPPQHSGPPNRPGPTVCASAGDSNTKRNSEHVEVPGWRICVYPPLYRMEGTENTEDEAYRRRHSRLEAEERRQRRWEMERLKHEDLRCRQTRQNGAAAEDRTPAFIDTFLPNPQHITHIEMVEEIPVIAFGQVLPKVSQQDFKLPWVVKPRTRQSLHTHRQH